MKDKTFFFQAIAIKERKTIPTCKIFFWICYANSPKRYKDLLGDNWWNIEPRTSTRDMIIGERNLVHIYMYSSTNIEIVNEQRRWYTDRFWSKLFKVKRPMWAMIYLDYKIDYIPVQLTFAVSRNGTLIYGGYSMFDVEYGIWGQVILYFHECEARVNILQNSAP